MAEQTDTRTGIKYGWATGDAGWGDDMNVNLQTLAQIGTHPLVKGIGTTAPPTSPAPVDGDIYILGASATGDWVGWDENSLAVYSYTSTAYTALGWRNIEPKTGWVISDGTNLRHYNGSSWATIGASSGGGGMNLFKGAWSGTSVNYTEGQIVVFRREQYMCNTTHTSTPSNGPTFGSEWRRRWHALSIPDVGELGAPLESSQVANDDRIAVSDESTSARDTKYMSMAHLKTFIGSGGSTSSSPTGTITLTAVSTSGTIVTRDLAGMVGDASGGYIFGGHSGSNALRDFKGYVVTSGVAAVADTTTTGATISARFGMGMTGSKTAFIIYGGRDTSRFNDFHHCAVSTNITVTALTLTGTITARSNHGMVGSAILGLIFGGSTGTGTRSNEFHRYSANVANRTVTTTALTVTGSISARELMGMVGDATAGLIVGGYDGTNRLSDFHRYTATATAVTLTSLKVVGGFTARSEMSIVGTATAGVIFGGNDGTTNLDDFYSYTVDTATDTVTLTQLVKTGTITARRAANMVGTTTSVLVFGGHANVPLNDFTSGAIALSTTTNTASGDIYKGDWVVGAMYNVGHIVRYVNRFFICHMSHTASLSNAPYSNANWRSTWRGLTFPDVGELSIRMPASRLEDDDRFVVSDESTTGDLPRYVTKGDLFANKKDTICLTQAEYTALSPKAPNTLYFITS